jgi:ABC-type nitrate/sulfonate/bicarbonate transport system permease component
MKTLIRKPISSRYSLMLSALGVAILALGYWKISYDQHLINPKDTTLPSFSQIYDGLIKVVTPDSSGKIWLYEDAKATMSRHAFGLSLGVLLSLVIGLMAGCFTAFEAFIMPVLAFFSKIPPTAMLVVYFVLFGTDFQMFIAVVALGTAPILAQSICQSVQKDVSECDIDKGYTLGASSAEIIWNIIFKKIMPRFIESVRLQAGPALILLIAAEMMVADIGFGYRLRIQGRLLNMNVVFVYLIFLGIFYHLVDWSLRLSRRKICKWFGD